MTAAAPYDPDRWARRWALGLGIAVLVTSFTPTWVSYDRLFEGPGDGWTTAWARFTRLEGADRLHAATPIVVGLTLLVASAIARRRARTYILVALAAARLAYLASWMSGVFSPDVDVLSSGLEAALVLACACVAAAQHRLRRRPDSSPRRTFARWSAGALLVVALAGIVLYWSVPNTAYRPVSVLYVGGAAYALLALWGTLRGDESRVSRLFPWVTRAGLVLYPLTDSVVYRLRIERLVDDSNHDFGPVPWVDLAAAAQSFAYMLFGTAALALAVILDRRDPPAPAAPVDPAVARVFE